MLLLTDDLANAATFKSIFEEVQICSVSHVGDALRRSPVHSFIVCVGNPVDPATFEAFSAALKHHRIQPSIPVLFLATEDSEVFAEKAAALATTEVVPATSSGAELVSAARRCIRGKIKSSYVVRDDTTALRNSVEAVGECLTKVFDAAKARRPISPGFLSRSADMLMASVRQARLTDWIELVRRYDDTTYQHCLLVAGLTAAFTARLGYTLESQHVLSQAALVHDVGKAHIPKAILCKPGALTSAEQAQIRTHPAIGHELLSHGKHDPIVLDVVLRHHELLDGSGYPHGLKRSQISGAVRAVTICDIFAALIERRPYKEPLSREDARNVLHGMSGQLDMSLVAAFDTVATAA